MRIRRKLPLVLSAMAAAVGALALPNVTPVSAATTPEIWVTGQNNGHVFVLKNKTLVADIDLNPFFPGFEGIRPHYVNFTTDGAFGAISLQGTGHIAIVDAANRQVVQTFAVPVPDGAARGDLKTPQAKFSPDNQFLFVTNIGVLEKAGTRKLVRYPVIPASGGNPLQIDTANLVELIFPQDEGVTCTAFRPDGQRAYVTIGSLVKVGIEKTGVRVIDPNTMTFVNDTFLPVTGDPQCSAHDPINGRDIILNANGRRNPPPEFAGGNGDSQGHLYRLDTSNDTITEIGPVNAIGAKDFHDNWPSGPDPKTDAANRARGNRKATIVYGSSRGSDELKRINLRTNKVETFPVDPRPGIDDKPDTMSGDPKANLVLVNLKDAGVVVFVTDAAREDNRPPKFSFVQMPVDPVVPVAQGGNPGFQFAIHSVTVRPGTTTP